MAVMEPKALGLRILGRVILSALAAIAIHALLGVWSRPLRVSPAGAAPRQYACFFPDPPPVVKYNAGWNLVALPTGTKLPSGLGPLYTWQPGDTTYEMTTTPMTGYGYWLYLPAATALTLNEGTTKPYTVKAPPGQWFMVGNPSGTSYAEISGADAAFVYRPPANGSMGGYTQTTCLRPGDGAWVMSNAGATITVTPCLPTSICP